MLCIPGIFKALPKFHKIDAVKSSDWQFTFSVIYEEIMMRKFREPFQTEKSVKFNI